MMCDIDLTHIDKPFGKLDRDTQLALFTAWLDGKEIEFALSSSGWLTLTNPSWNSCTIYRVVSNINVPDYIDWSHVHPNYKYMTRDKDGIVYLWTHLPAASYENKWWYCTHAVYSAADVNSHASYKQGTVSWENSLVKRPA